MSREKLGKLTEKQQENKKEDKKAVKKFILILVTAFIVGIGIGAGSAFVREVLGNATAKEAIVQVLQILAVYGGYVFTTVLLAACILLYKKSRREYASWDEEDEDVLQGIETKLSFGLWFSNLILFGSYFFFAVGVWAVELADAESAIQMDEAGFGLSIGVVFLHMAYALAASCIVQQKLVNLTKEINPEKRAVSMI